MSGAGRLPANAGAPAPPELLAEPTGRRTPLAGLYAGNARAVVGRGLRVMAKNNLLVIVSGFFEPVLYLLSLGLGLGALVGEVAFHGQPVPYAAYIAPALLATSAMNGAVYDSTMNVYFRMHYAKLYDSQLATSLGPLDVTLGEIFMALLRGVLYSLGFLAVMQLLGLNGSWTALLAVPAVVLVAFAFASLGFAATSFMRTFQHLEWVGFVLLPMFLLSATFFPVEAYPGPVRVVVQCLPLWHGVEMMRMLTTGIVDAGIWSHALYFALLGAFGVVVATLRLRSLFLR